MGWYFLPLSWDQVCSFKLFLRILWMISSIFPFFS
jgi:hypothetical protein